MIIKKFQGKTEQEAILAAKEEMGSNAIVMNIRTTKPKGLARIWKKDHVEVTAALEEREDLLEKELAKPLPPPPIVKPDIGRVEDTLEFEKKLNSIQYMLEQQILEKETKEKSEKVQEEPAEMDEKEKEKMSFLRLVYNQLLNNEVEEVYVNQIIHEIERSLKRDVSLDMVLSTAYQKIILKLGEPEEIPYKEGQKKMFFFMGPTGVGKTTTIAKLASDLKLNKNAKVTLVTADTYRIAAVEQLRIYANILDIPLTIVYSDEDLKHELHRLKEYDVVLVDTAGRSHKNLEQCEELFQLLDVVSAKSGFEKELFLVLSVTTKYKDLEKICKTYEQAGSYRVIFTKLDETGGVGNILNVAMLTDHALSYTTYGQSVPDDISVVDVQQIAKKLLGGAFD